MGRVVAWLSQPAETARRDCLDYVGLCEEVMKDYQFRNVEAEPPRAEVISATIVQLK